MRKRMEARGRGMASVILLHGALAAVLVLLFASVNAQAACPGTCTSPNACNGVTIKVELTPQKIGIDIVGLVTTCGGAVVNSCSPPSFATTTTMTKNDKCLAIRAALSDPACVAAGYTLSAAALCADPTNSVTATDACAGGVVEFVTTNESPVGSVFTGNTGNVAQVDYERDMITPSCRDQDATPNNGNDNVAQVTLAGTATGTSITGGVASEQVVVDQSPNGGPVLVAGINTSAGMTSLHVIQALCDRLIQLGFPASRLSVIGNRALRIQQPSTGNPIKVGISEDDTGFNHDSRVAPVNRLPVPVSTPSTSAPALSTWGVVLLMLMMMGVAVWMIRRTMSAARPNSGA